MATQIEANVDRTTHAIKIKGSPDLARKVHDEHACEYHHASLHDTHANSCDHAHVHANSCDCVLHAREGYDKN